MSGLRDLVRVMTGSLGGWSFVVYAMSHSNTLSRSGERRDYTTLSGTSLQALLEDTGQPTGTEEFSPEQLPLPLRWPEHD